MVGRYDSSKEMGVKNPTADDPLGVTHLAFALGAVFFGTVVVLT